MMRFGVDVKRCGQYYRANPDKQKPKYLEWLELTLLKMVMSVIKTKLIHNKIRMKKCLQRNKKDRDRLRRRLILDAKIGVNYKICSAHGTISFPMCRTRLSDYYWVRRCPECHYDKLERAERKEELQERRERANFASKFIGFMSNDMAWWNAERVRYHAKGPLTRSQCKYRVESALIRQKIDSIELGFINDID